MVSVTVDERCDMELDETDPANWQKLESAVEEYIETNSESFKNACERLLLPLQHEDKLSENFKSQQIFRAKAPNAGTTRFTLRVFTFFFSFVMLCL